MDCGLTTPIFSIIAAITGAVTGWLLSSRTAIRALSHQKFLDAAADFRAAFVPELQKLMKPMSEIPTERETAKDIIDNAIGRHEAAMIKFRHYIAKNKRAAFDLAWKEYENPDSEQFPNDKRLFYFNGGDPEREKQVRQEINDKIDVLWAFTEV